MTRAGIRFGYEIKKIKKIVVISHEKISGCKKIGLCQNLPGKVLLDCVVKFDLFQPYNSFNFELEKKNTKKTH